MQSVVCCRGFIDRRCGGEAGRPAAFGRRRRNASFDRHTHTSHPYRFFSSTRRWTRPAAPPLLMLLLEYYAYMGCPGTVVARDLATLFPQSALIGFGFFTQLSRFALSLLFSYFAAGARSLCCCPFGFFGINFGSIIFSLQSSRLAVIVSL
jgi:hypothetical protein